MYIYRKLTQSFHLINPYLLLETGILQHFCKFVSHPLQSSSFLAIRRCWRMPVRRSLTSLVWRWDSATGYGSNGMKWHRCTHTTHIYIILYNEIIWDIPNNKRLCKLSNKHIHKWDHEQAASDLIGGFKSSLFPCQLEIYERSISQTSYS